jgi:hypothetical protein
MPLALAAMTVGLLDRLQIEDAKPVFIFDAATELAFIKQSFTSIKLLSAHVTAALAA